MPGTVKSFVLVRLTVGSVEIAIVRLIHQVHCLTDQIGCQGIQPVNPGVTPEPSHLLSGQTFCLLGYQGEGSIKIGASIKVVLHLGVPQGTCCGGTQIPAESTDLTHQVVAAHGLGPGIYTSVQLLPVQVQANLDSRQEVTVPGQGGGIGTTCNLHDLKGPDRTPDVSWVHPSRRPGVLLLQLLEQQTGPLGLRPLLDAGPDRLVGPGKGQVIDDGTGIETRTTHQDGPDTAPPQIVYQASGHLLEPGHAHGFPGFDYIDQMVGHGGTFLGRGLGRTHIHPPVHLVGIGIDDLGLFTSLAQGQGKGHTQTRLSRCGRTDDGNDARHPAVHSLI